jgi:hypothetical protein
MDIIKLTKESISELQPRAFDEYALGGFLIWYGLKSKNMGKWPRRILITAGIYQVMYGLPKYQAMLSLLKNPPQLQTTINNKLKVALDE